MRTTIPVSDTTQENKTHFKLIFTKNLHSTSLKFLCGILLMLGEVNHGYAQNPAEWLSVKTYGAVADAAVAPGKDTATGTDLAPSLNAAFAAALDGQVVVVPAGKWVLHTAIDTIRNKRIMLIVYGTVYCNKRTFLRIYPPTIGMDRPTNEIRQKQHDVRIYGQLIGAANLPSHNRGTYDAGKQPNWTAMTGTAFELLNMFSTHIEFNKVSGFQNAIDLIASSTDSFGGQQNTFAFQEIDRCANGISMRSLSGKSYMDKNVFSGINGGLAHIDAGLGIKMDGYSGTNYSGEFGWNCFQNILLERVDSAIDMRGNIVETYFNHLKIEAGSSKGVFGSHVFTMRNVSPNYVRNTTFFACGFFYVPWFNNASLGIGGKIISTPIFTNPRAILCGSDAKIDASGNIILEKEPTLNLTYVNALPPIFKVIDQSGESKEDVSITTAAYTLAVGVAHVMFDNNAGTFRLPPPNTNVKRTVTVHNLNANALTVAGPLAPHQSTSIAGYASQSYYCDGTNWYANGR